MLWKEQNGYYCPFFTNEQLNTQKLVYERVLREWYLSLVVEPHFLHRSLSVVRLSQVRLPLSYNLDFLKCVTAF